jgi:hypothetical protein
MKIIFEQNADPIKFKQAIDDTFITINVHYMSNGYKMTDKVAYYTIYWRVL